MGSEAKSRHWVFAKQGLTWSWAERRVHHAAEDGFGGDCDDDTTKSGEDGAVALRPTKKSHFGKVSTKGLSLRGAISSDLYRHHFWEDILNFPFFVFISHEFMLHLHYIWWKKLSSSLKTFFYPFCANFRRSHVRTWDLRFSQIYMI